MAVNCLPCPLWKSEDLLIFRSCENDEICQSQTSGGRDVSVWLGRVPDLAVNSELGLEISR